MTLLISVAVGTVRENPPGDAATRIRRAERAFTSEINRGIESSAARTGTKQVHDMRYTSAKSIDKLHIVCENY